MMASVVCTDIMSIVDGLHTPLADFQPPRNSNVFPPKGALSLEVAYGSRQHGSSAKRCSQATSPGSSMPASTSSQSLLASLPSFMSVFGNGPDRLEAYEGEAETTTSQDRTSKKPLNVAQPTLPTFRRDSTSTFESTESSPTTTISTVESSLTEPSPRSPPETPDSSSPLPSFKNLRTNSMPANHLDMERKDQFSSSFPTLPGVERADSPNKKMRNMKNLSVNTSASNRTGLHFPKLGLSNPSQTSANASSAPPTPAFIVPPKMPKKKPSTLPLTITTPDSSISGQDRSSAIAQTPSDPQIRTLRLLQTSSQSALFSPTVAPEGGMRLPPFATPSASSRPFATGGRAGKARPPLSVSPLSSFDNSTSSPITRQTLDHVQEETDYEPPLSQEVKSPAYPQGPVCIYDPHIYLYLEPNHVEAREFDVILNVAREVLNPFLAPDDKDTKLRSEGSEIQEASDADNAFLAGRDSVSEPHTAVSEKSFASVLDAQREDASMTAPGTPKATRPEPEYIHVPWDHNTNVVDDLLRLCELMENRVRQSKRVLVHCQCGVSRSASLVVAYGLYKNPQLTVQEAYDAVKFRSKWIGPNMNLIYQLSEFKSKLAKTHSSGTGWHSWRALGSRRPNPNAAVEPAFDSASASSGPRSPPQKSLSAPSQIGRDSRSSSFSPPSSAQLAPTSSGGITPGPSSAPPDMVWSLGQRSPAPERDAVSSHAEPLSISPPIISSSDTDLVSSPSTMEREDIEKKGTSAPIERVTNDLQEVAKDLANHAHSSTDTILPKLDFGPDIRMSISTSGEESFGGRVAVPAAGTSQDSQPEASDSYQDLDNKAMTASGSLPRLVDLPTEDSRSQTPSGPATEKTESTISPLLPMPTSSTPSPTFPAGFSSLLRRRQGPRALRNLPLRQGMAPPQLTMAHPSPRAIDPDVPQTPSLLSPRAAEFTASPFHRTAAGDLAGSSVFEQSLMSPGAKEEDPRSPHQIGKAPITRSIFDMI